MKIRANNIDLIDAERFDSFSWLNCKIEYCCCSKKLNNTQLLNTQSSIVWLFIKAAIFNFAVENDARKAVKTFCIYKINIVGSNFHAQNVLFPNLQSA